MSISFNTTNTGGHGHAHGQRHVTTYETYDDFITPSFEERDMEMQEISTFDLSLEPSRKETQATAEGIDKLVHDRFPFIEEFGGRKAFEKLIAAPPKSLSISLEKGGLLNQVYSLPKPVLHLEDANVISIRMDLAIPGSFLARESQTWDFRYHPDSRTFPIDLTSAYTTHLTGSVYSYTYYLPVLDLLAQNLLSESGSSQHGGTLESRGFGHYLKSLVDGEATPEGQFYENRTLSS